MYTNTELICSIISLINAITAIVIYIHDHKVGTDANSGSRYKSIMTCCLMSVIFGGISFSIMIYNLHTRH